MSHLLHYRYLHFHYNHCSPRTRDDVFKQLLLVVSEGRFSRCQINLMLKLLHWIHPTSNKPTSRQQLFKQLQMKLSMKKRVICIKCKICCNSQVCTCGDRLHDYFLEKDRQEWFPCLNRFQQLIDRSHNDSHN